MSILKGLGGVPEKPDDKNLNKSVIKHNEARDIKKTEFTTIPVSAEEAKLAKEKLDNISRKVQTPAATANKEAEKIIEQAKLRVAQMFASAKEDAKKMMDSAKLLVQSRLAEAQQEGHVLGHKQGFEEGKKAAEETLAGLVENAKEAFSRLLIEKEALLENTKEEIAKLTLACVKEILGEEIKTNPEVILNVAKNAVEMAKGESGSEVIVFVNPDDKDMVESKKEIFAGVADIETLKIKSDHSITRGGCRVTTNLGTVDATFETQLIALEIAFEAAGKGYNEDEST